VAVCVEVWSLAVAVCAVVTNHSPTGDSSRGSDSPAVSAAAWLTHKQSSQLTGRKAIPAEITVRAMSMIAF